MRLNEWNVTPDAQTADYHSKQYAEPYRSTVHFAEFIRDYMADAKLCVDAGCGGGAPTNYLATAFPATQFIGFDESETLISGALERKSRPSNLDYKAMSFENIQIMFGVDAVVLMQVLSWLPEYVTPLHQIKVRLKPKWIAFSTLLYSGDIDCQIIVRENRRPRRSFYNIYGLPGLVRFLAGEGYKPAKIESFNIDIDLPEGDHDFMHTRTVPPMRTMFSGPLYLPWGFALFERGV
jgi:2-polyprenyl-3-methyl-5-hydroxy-6-metoxy-1,4-benzoquinol methylase